MIHCGPDLSASLHTHAAPIRCARPFLSARARPRPCRAARQVEYVSEDVNAALSEHVDAVLEAKPWRPGKPPVTVPRDTIDEVLERVRPPPQPATRSAAFARAWSSDSSGRGGRISARTRCPTPSTSPTSGPSRRRAATPTMGVHAGQLRLRAAAVPPATGRRTRAGEPCSPPPGLQRVRTAGACRGAWACVTLDHF